MVMVKVVVMVAKWLLRLWLWLRVVGLGLGPGNALAVLKFFFSSGPISVVNTFVFIGLVVSLSLCLHGGLLMNIK